MAEDLLRIVSETKDRKTKEVCFAQLNKDYDLYSPIMKARIVLRGLQNDIPVYWLTGDEGTLLPHLDLFPLLKFLREIRQEQRHEIVDTWLETHSPTKETRVILSVACNEGTGKSIYEIYKEIEQSDQK